MPQFLWRETREPAARTTEFRDPQVQRWNYFLTKLLLGVCPRVRPLARLEEVDENTWGGIESKRIKQDGVDMRDENEGIDTVRASGSMSV